MKTSWMLVGSIVGLVACGDRGLFDDRAREVDPPTLTVTEPARALRLSQAKQVKLKGHVTDEGSGLKHVTVNGMKASVSAEGNFEVQLAITPGLTLIKTEAVDRDGNTSTDARSVLAGEFAPANVPVVDAVYAEINKATLHAVALVASEKLSGRALGDDLAATNPLMDKGGSCLGAKINLIEMKNGPIRTELDPVEGGVRFMFEIKDLDALLKAKFYAVCIPGSEDIVLKADAFRVHGVLEFWITDQGKLRTQVTQSYGEWDNFFIDTGSIPQSVVELFVGDLDEAIADGIADAIDEKVPETIDEAMDEFGNDKAITVLDQEVLISVKPQTVDFSAEGGVIAIDASIVLPGLVGGEGYIPTPAVLPPALSTTTDGFQIGIADDIINVGLTQFWSTGQMDKSFPVSDVGSGGAFSKLIDRVDVRVVHPPMAMAHPDDKGLTVVVGDVFVDGMQITDGHDKLVSQLALSAEIEITVEADVLNNLKLKAVHADFWIDSVVTANGDRNPLDNHSLEELGSFLAMQFTGLVGEIVGETPLPSLKSVRFVNLNMHGSPQGGYAILGGRLEPNLNPL